jgi:putative tryptophan/tyrosine transport system substrate-binding protein
MDRRGFLLTSLAGALTAPFAAEAQQTQSPRIGYLWSGKRGSDPVETGGLLQGLHELGYSEGRNIVIEYRYAEDELDRLPGLVAELTGLKVAVLVSVGTPVTAAAKREAGETPVVSVSSDPVGLGFVRSLARPGGTLTGLSTGPEADFCGKWVELVKELVPKASRVGIIWNPANQSSSPIVKKIEVLAPPLGLRLTPQPVEGPVDIDAAFATLVRNRVAALIIVTDPFLAAHRDQILRLAASGHIATVAGVRYCVEPGGLLYYGPNFFDLFRRAAYFVDKILKGAKPADLPVEQPTKFELVINLKTAKALGLTIPPSLLARADQVIE